jgi:para-aminobenzoate synthetase component I
MDDIHATALPYSAPEDIFATFAAEDYALFFDSQTRTERYSYIAIRPESVFSATHPANCNNASIAINRFGLLLKKFQDIQILRKKSALPPFQGGLAGYIFFEAGHVVNFIPLPQTHGQPTSLFCVGFYPAVFVFDTIDKLCFLFCLSSHQHLKDYFKKAFLTAQKKLFPLPWSVTLQPVQTREDYIAVIEKARAYIAAGDIAQVNIAQTFAGSLPEDVTPYMLFQRLRQYNPTPFAAYFKTPQETLISCSPEQFLASDGKTLLTRPIKGTAPASPHPAEDAVLRQHLCHSAKDLAENRMIVDLLRHDLSKSCLPGSVQVPAFATLETYEGVHHLVSTVTGLLRPEVNALSAFWEAFPGGSITGAPKRRAIEIIQELEQSPRGAYCGSLGYWGAGGVMNSNILIRTLVIKDRQVSLKTGGGITYASNAASEYEESLAKAAPIRQALQVHTA